MKRFLSCSLFVVTLACSRSETTEVATTSDTVSPETTITLATETITPGTPAPAPTATGTIAADTVGGTPSTTPGVASPAAPRSKTSAPKPQAPAPAPQTEVPPPQVSAVTEPVPTPKVENPPPVDAAPAPTATIADGQALFKTKCAGCHGADGKKPQGGRTLASEAVQSQSDTELAKIIREGKGKVSAAGHKRAALNSAQISAVVAYIKALK